MTDPTPSRDNGNSWSGKLLRQLLPILAIAGLAAGLAAPPGIASVGGMTAQTTQAAQAARSTVATGFTTCNHATAENIGECVADMLNEVESPYSAKHVYTEAEKQVVRTPKLHTLAAAGPAQVGSWTTLPGCTVNGYPVNAIHAVLTKTGKVLILAGSGWNSEYFRLRIFKAWLLNPAQLNTCPKELTLPDKDLFCSGHMMLADGRIVFFGGTSRYGVIGTGPGQPNYYGGLRDSYAFDDVTEAFTATGPMNVAGWYPNATANAAGSPIKVGGLDENGVLTSTNEIFNPSTNIWSKLLGSRRLPMYATMHLLKNGTMLYSGGYFAGRVGAVPGRWNWSNNQFTPIPGLPNPDYRDQGFSAMLDSAQSQKIMVGQGGYSNSTTGTTAIVDMKAASPSFKPGPYVFPAMHSCGLLLPDGSLFVTGGGNHNTNPVLRAMRLPYPYTGSWQDMASPTVPRLYHNTCLLLPDGSVLTMGTNAAITGGVEVRMEIYKPPYMFYGRPNITSFPTTIRLGGTYQASYTGPASVNASSLMKPASITHSVDNNARKVYNGVTAAGAGKVNLKIEPNWGILPLGYYMLWLRDWRGIPSNAKFVRVIQAATPSATSSKLITEASAPAAASAPCCCC